MVRLLKNNGKFVKKVFNSADEARRWFNINKQKGETARIISETKFRTIFK